MSLVVEFAVEIPPLRHASRAVPEMRFRGEDIVVEDGQPHKFVFRAHGERFDDFEAALEADPTVAAYTVLEREAEAAYYVVTYSSTPMEGTYHVAVEHDVAYLSVDLQDGVHRVQACVPDRAALAALREHCRESGIPFRLERLCRERPSTVAVPGLTDAQREALELAYERGYFDSPRETTLEAIAGELDISRQALADRLRRGHKQLVETVLDVDGRKQGESDNRR